MPFSPPGDLPDTGIEPGSICIAGGFFTTESPGKPFILGQFYITVFPFLFLFIGIIYILGKLALCDMGSKSFC